MVNLIPQTNYIDIENHSNKRKTIDDIENPSPKRKKIDDEETRNVQKITHVTVDIFQNAHIMTQILN